MMWNKLNCLSQTSHITIYIYVAELSDIRYIIYTAIGILFSKTGDFDARKAKAFFLYELLSSVNTLLTSFVSMNSIKHVSFIVRR